MIKAKLTLYVMGSSSRATQAIANIRMLVEAHVDDVEFDVVDILEHPEIAEQEKIFATPMLVKSAPPPRKKVIGDLGDKDLVWKQLSLN